MHERLTAALGIVGQLADRTRPLEPLPVGALGAVAGTSTSTTSRICAELEGLGMIARGQGYGTYRIGARAVALSGAAAAPFAVVSDFALTLAYQATGETVALVADSPRGATVIGVVQSAWTLHVATSVGDVLTDPGGAATRTLRNPPSAAAHPAVLASRSGVSAEVATPVLGPRGECLAALVVRYPSHRSEQVTPMAERAVLAARRHLERSVAALPEPTGAVNPPAAAGGPDGLDGLDGLNGLDGQDGRSALEAAVQVLEAIRPGGTTVPELARVTGLRPARVQRLLEVCDGAGLTCYNVDGDAATLRWVVHGWHRALIDSTLRGPAQRLVAAISARAGTTAYLTVRRGMRSSTVAEAIVDGPLNMGSWLGRPAQLIGSDGGPVLVQHFDDAQIRQVFPSRNTITASGTPKDLTAFLQQVQRARAATPLVLPDFGEDGLTSVAAPVRDAGGAVVAAACIVGPGPAVAARLATIKQLAGELAAEVSRLLRAPEDARAGREAGHRPGRAETVAGQSRPQ